MAEPRIAYLGDLGSVAESLAAFPGARLCLCVCEEGDDSEVLAGVSRKAGVPFFRVKSVGDLRSALAAAGSFDLGVLGNFGLILPPELLAVPRLGWVNLHLGLLPENPGRHPIRAVLERGEAFTGVTLHRATAVPDAGPILARRLVPMPPDGDPAKILDRLSRVSAELLTAELPSLLL